LNLNMATELRDELEVCVASFHFVNSFSRI